MVEASKEGSLVLVVTSHDRKLLEVGCEEVTVPGRLGEIGVLPGHAPLITTLRPGVLAYRGRSGGGRVVLSAGFCQIYQDRVIVLTDRAWLPSEVDPRAAEERILEINAELERGEPERLLQLHDDLNEAQAMLSVSR